jgi:hypothetical protein
MVRKWSTGPISLSYTTPAGADVVLVRAARHTVKVTLEARAHPVVGIQR